MSAQTAPTQIKISDNKRFFVRGDGAPFFYLADTAWELFHRVNREEADRYLQNRAAKGFTVIQAVVLAELDGLNDPNSYGEKPLIDNDPTKPNPKYFEHVDYIVRKAASLGLVTAMLPTWGDKWNRAVGQGGIFTPENARVFGDFLGRRYAGSPIIWTLGGDRPVENDTHRAILKAMAEGLRAGDGGRHLITFHPPGGANSSRWFHNESWLDFNSWQTGHSPESPVWESMRADYERTPVKPVINSEPLYEDHPIGFKARERGYSNAADVRRLAYLSLFAGACGYTYGNHSVWQMSKPGKGPINGPLNFWYDALDKPGATQMRHVRTLMESRPYLVRVPDQTLIAPNPGTTEDAVANVNAGFKRIQATRASDGSYAFIYFSSSRPITINTGKLSGQQIRASWFDPRTGQSTSIGTFAQSADKLRQFTPPNEGENLDWVLILDDAARNFPAIPAPRPTR